MTNNGQRSARAAWSGRHAYPCVRIVGTEIQILDLYVMEAACGCHHVIVDWTDPRWDRLLPAIEVDARFPDEV